MPTEESKSPPPPYMSYGVFKSTIDTLADASLPTGALDRRVLDGISGADHGALMSGLKFLGYVDDERRATSTYRQLVEASKNPAEFKTRLLEVISDKYAPVIGNMDIAGGIIADLEKAFKSYGVPAGQMLTKTIRFYVKALTECGAVVSPYITKPKPKSPRTPGKRNGKSTGAKGTIVQSGSEVLTPKGFERMLVPGMQGAFIQYPLNLTEAHCNLFAAMITTLRAYAKAQSGGKEETE